MKTLYSTFIFSLVLTLGVQSQQIWDNFQDTRTGTYGFINGTFIPYSLNPDPTGANTSLVAATYTRNPAETFDVIILDQLMADLSDYVAGTKQMSIDVWSPSVGTTIQITLENSVTALPANYPTGRHSVYLTETTVANAWETLTFSYDIQPDPSVPATDVDRLVLLFNPNSNTGDTYYWDNLNGPELADDPCAGVATNESILNDFECQQNVNFIAASAAPSLRRELNPDQSGNDSEYVGTYTRSGAEDDNFIGRFDGNLELNENSTQITMDIWDPNAPSTVLFSLQTVTNELILEMTAETSASEQWETLTFDILPEIVDNMDIGQFVILIEPGATSTDQYYFDNIEIPGLVSNNDIDYVSGLKAFPNPANGNVSLEYNLINSGDVNITITDITGRVLENRLFENQPSGTHFSHFNTDAYADGIYLYNVSVGGKNNTGKIVVNN